MPPFHTLNYRKALIDLLQRRRTLDPKLTYSRVSAAAGVQATYFSNVLKGRADFSSDQLYQICQSLKLSEAEMEYLLMALEWARSTVPARRASLKSKLEMIRNQHLRATEHVSAKPVQVSNLELAEYYLDPTLQIVHVHLGMPRFANEPLRIAERLGIAPQHLSRLLERLERLGLVVLERDGRYRVLVRNRHLPEDSPVCLPHQTLLRLKSAEQLSKLKSEERQVVSVTFSATQETVAQIRSEFLAFLKKTEALVKAAQEEEVYQLNFDLFPWGEKR